MIEILLLPGPIIFDGSKLLAAIKLVPLPHLVVLLFGIVAAATDLSRFKVHNALTFPLIATGIAYHTIIGGPIGLAQSLGGICIGGGILLVPYLLGGLGGGDVKLVAGVGAWLLIPQTVYVLIVSSLAAGAYAAALLVVYGGMRETMLSFRAIFYRMRTIGAHLGSDESFKAQVDCVDRRRRIIPFAALIVMAMVFVAVWPK